MIGLTYTELRKLNPCEDAIKRVARLMGGAKKWNDHKCTAEEARAAGATFGDLIWAASAVALADEDVERRLRLWMADCAARVLQHFETRYPTDDRPRKAIIAGRQSWTTTEQTNDH